jgi:hypothetical protein
MADNYPTPAPARTPTQEEVLDERELAVHINQQLTAAISHAREDLWHVARWAYEADLEAIWLKLGCETKGEWLAWPEVHMTRATFDRMARVFRETVVRRHVDASSLKHLDVSKVDIAMRAVNHHQVTLQEALSDAESLGANDMREKYVAPPALPESDEPDDSNGDGVFDEDELASYEPAPEDDPEYEQQVDEDGSSDADTDDAVLLPRWLVQEIVDLYGPTRRMKREWLDLLEQSLEREAANAQQ